MGTIPFEAALLGRHAVSNDKSPFASLIAMAKLNPPSLDEARKAALTIMREMGDVSIGNEDFGAASFGLNASVADYYHPQTLEEVLKARKLFLQRTEWDRAHSFFWASLLHVLHGNRPYALSRKSHPITPFAPQGPFEYKNLIEKVTARMERALVAGLPATFRYGEGLQGDFRDLPNVIEPVDVILTSPPFIGMRFDRPNWLRLWFCGWKAEDFHVTSLGFLEREQARSRDCYSDFFDVSHQCLEANGLLVVHVGSGGRATLDSDLKRLAADRFRLVGEVSEDVSHLEQHGLSDKTLTTAHHLLFFRPL